MTQAQTTFADRLRARFEVAHLDLALVPSTLDAMRFNPPVYDADRYDPRIIRPRETEFISRIAVRLPGIDDVTAGRCARLAFSEWLASVETISEAHPKATRLELLATIRAELHGGARP